MKAVVYSRYGNPDVLYLQDVEKPTPKENEVLVKVHSSSVNAADWHLLTADIFLVRLDAGLVRPKNMILGCDIAGQVESVGSAVTKFKPGDEVFGDIFRPKMGAFAEYVSAPESLLALKPANLSFSEAGAVPLAARTALQGLRDLGHVQPGQKVLVNGASGGVGTYAVQIAKYYGADITAVCSTGNLDMARSLGANHVIDYTKEDFTLNGQQYDLILAVNGYHPITAYQRALSPKGTYIHSGGTLAQYFQAMLRGPRMSKSDGQHFGLLTLKADQIDMPFLKELVESRKLVPVIDKQFSLNEVSEAFRHFGKGHARGKIGITVA